MTLTRRSPLSFWLSGLLWLRGRATNYVECRSGGINPRYFNGVMTASLARQHSEPIVSDEKTLLLCWCSLGSGNVNDATTNFHWAAMTLGGKEKSLRQIIEVHQFFDGTFSRGHSAVAFDH